MAYGYFDLFEAIQKDAYSKVQKDRKGVCLAVGLKPLQKPSFSDKEAIELTKKALKGKVSEKCIPQDVVVAFDVYDPECDEFDAMWFSGHCEKYIQAVTEILGIERHPCGHYRCVKSGSERYVEITISWKEVGGIGGTYGLLF